ncbi:Outer membrane protein TolC [Selenomonas sp. GACV-9]|uniref:TolC family protein n=1 Tax=Selenomonas sp. GACV-9 TaxID=3158782 RepID=UPI0008E3AF96|nr:Outer membrane protein TolC [Selenomonas ruminantium]
MKKSILLIPVICTALAFPFSTAQAETVGLTLADSIKMALHSDESIEGAQAGRAAALYGWKAARRQKGPTVNWNSQAYRIGGRNYEAANEAHSRYGNPHVVTKKTVTGYVFDNEGFPVVSEQSNTVGSYAYKNTFANSWNLSIPIYTGGQLENQIKAGGYQLNRADLTVENARQTVRYQAAESYAELLHYENLAQVAREAVDMGRKQMDIIRAQFEEGAVAEADMLTMNVSLANYRQNLVQAEAQVAIAKSVLASIVGLPQDTDVEPLDYFSYEPYGKDLPDCEAYALAHRPDGLAADYDIKAAQARKAAAKAGWSPQVTGVANQAIASNSPFASERSNAWEAGIALSWNIFDNGVTSANVQAAASAVNQYEAEARRTKKAIRLETRRVYLQMKAAEQNIKETALVIQQAEDSYKIAQVRYEEGVDILLSVTDAQDKLTQAKFNYMTALYQYNLYRASLEKAMGVPVGFDALAYTEAEQAGASADKALQAAGLREEAP